MSVSTKDGDNFFIPMTDMMVGLLFIFVIMVAFFAYKLSRQLSQEQFVPQSLLIKVTEERDDMREKLALIKANSVVKFNQNSRDSQKAIIRNVKDAMERTGIGVSADYERGLLRLQGIDLFGSSSTTLKDPVIVRTLASALQLELTCYVLPASRSKDCEGKVGYVEAVYIEGHTDALRVGISRQDGISNNLQLAARRATNTYETIVTSNPALRDYRNPSQHSILSVSAFGAQRPIAPNDTSEGRDRNRRIDLKVEMYVPKDEIEVETLRARL